jgi:uncharacterized membrane protein YhdT
MERQADRPRLLRLGIGLFAVGVLFILLTVVPLFFGAHNRALWLNLGCLLAPLGFLVIVVSAVRAGRAEQRRALAAVRSRSRPP